MTPKQLLAHYGGNKTEAAARLGYTPQALDKWVKSGSIPARPQRLIELITGGKLKANGR